MTLAAWINQRFRVMTTPAELVVERDGRPVAILSAPALDDMFWFKWKITPLIDDMDVMSPEFWEDSQIAGIVFRDKQTKAVVGSAFWPGTNPIRDGRLVLRGAYVPCSVSFRRQPFFWLKLLFFGNGALGANTSSDGDEKCDTQSGRWLFITTVAVASVMGMVFGVMRGRGHFKVLPPPTTNPTAALIQ